MPRWITSLGLAIALAGAPGCATLMSGCGSRLVVDVTAPEGAAGVTTTVRGVNNQDEITTTERHVEVPADRQANYVVVTSGDGLRHRISVAHVQPNPWVWGNYGMMAAGFALVVVTPSELTETSSGMPVRRSVDPPLGYGLVFAGAIGVLIDFVLKNAWQHDQRAFTHDMTPRQPPSPDTP
jgi:hypothetical protein